MSDYISKDELKERLVYCRGLGRTSLEAVLKAMDNTPTLDEKEIIRKAFERVLQRLEELKNAPKTECSWNNGWTECARCAIQEVKKEGGIE